MNQPNNQKTVGDLMKERYGADFYQRIGRKGGAVKVSKGFGKNRKLASKAGSVGGKISRPPKKDDSQAEGQNGEAKI